MLSLPKPNSDVRWKLKVKQEMRGLLWARINWFPQLLLHTVKCKVPWDHKFIATLLFLLKQQKVMKWLTSPRYFFWSSCVNHVSKWDRFWTQNFQFSLFNCGKFRKKQQVCWAWRVKCHSELVTILMPSLSIISIFPSILENKIRRRSELRLENWDSLRLSSRGTEAFHPIFL